jgi:hypothetical protein
MFWCIRRAKLRSTIFMLGWARHGSHKKRAKTYCVKLVFWYHVRSGGHVAHFGAFGVRNIDALFSFPDVPRVSSQEVHQNTLR